MTILVVLSPLLMMYRPSASLLEGTSTAAEFVRRLLPAVDFVLAFTRGQNFGRNLLAIGCSGGRGGVVQGKRSLLDNSSRHDSRLVHCFFA